MDDAFSTGYAVGRDSSSNNSNGMGWGGDWAWWIVILLIFGWGGFGNNFGGNGGSMLSGIATRNDLCEEFNFNNLENSVRGISDSVNLGFANLNSTICHQEYETAMLLNNMNVSNLQSFNAMNISNLQSANALQSQLASCCCDLRAGQAQTRYEMAQNTCNLQNTMNNSTRDIIASQECGTRAVIDKLCQMEYNALNDKYQMALNEIQGLRLDASQARQNNYLVSQLRPTPQPSFLVPNPFTGSYGYAQSGYGFNGGCGCGCGCNG